uniref:Uncharacterized protein n=1 Tax=Vombatus ursinus TaxID=29139 RepID=A0A4X2K573_VOMUR
MLLAGIVIEPGTFVPVLLSVSPLPLLPVGYVHDDQQRGAGDEDELQSPQADVGDGEEVVVADVGAARLARVTVKVLLLITPHALRRYHVHQHTEDEDHGEPDTAESRGVLVDSAQERLQGLPVHGCWAVGAGKNAVFGIRGQRFESWLCLALPNFGQDT